MRRLPVRTWAPITSVAHLTYALWLLRSIPSKLAHTQVASTNARTTAICALSAVTLGSVPVRQVKTPARAGLARQRTAAPYASCRMPNVITFTSDSSRIAASWCTSEILGDVLTLLSNESAVSHDCACAVPHAHTALQSPRINPPVRSMRDGAVVSRPSHTTLSRAPSSRPRCRARTVASRPHTAHFPGHLHWTHPEENAVSSAVRLAHPTQRGVEDTQAIDLTRPTSGANHSIVWASSVARNPSTRAEPDISLVSFTQ